MASDARNRLFVLFFDTFHVADPAASHNGRLRNPGSTAFRLPVETRMGPPANIDRALNNFLKTSIGPDDLLAAMTLKMDPSELTFNPPARGNRGLPRHDLSPPLFGRHPRPCRGALPYLLPARRSPAPLRRHRG